MEFNNIGLRISKGARKSGHNLFCIKFVLRAPKLFKYTVIVHKTFCATSCDNSPGIFSCLSNVLLISLITHE